MSRGFNYICYKNKVIKSKNDCLIEIEPKQSQKKQSI